MTKLKTHHILAIAHLLSVGAKSDFIKIDTKSLGHAIGRSQQSASSYLVELEKSKYIVRKFHGGKTCIMITNKGILQVRELSSVLLKSLDSKKANLVLAGTITSGLGEGAYYMSLKEYVLQFKDKIGYTPYPGTLNIKLEDVSGSKMLNMLTTREPDAVIDGFSDGKRTYGWVKCYKCTIHAKKCHLVRLERTHHKEGLAEIISETNLRRVCKLDHGLIKIVFAD